MWSTDPRHLQPEIPRVMREAAELVRSHPPPGYDQVQTDRLYDTLHAPYAERVRRQVRSALALESPEAQVANVVDIVNRLALTPPEEAQPLPIIGEEDIHLVCWMAIVPLSETYAPISERFLTISEQTGQFPLGDRL